MRIVDGSAVKSMPVGGCVGIHLGAYIGVIDVVRVDGDGDGTLVETIVVTIV